MKKIFLLILTLVMGLTLVSCNKETTIEKLKPITVTDMIGRTVTVDLNNNDRVVCIGAGALRLYSYIGDMNKLVGAEDIDRSVNANIFEGAPRPYYDLHKELLSTLPTVGIGGPRNQSAEAEKIIATTPNLIISEYEDETAANTLQEKVGVPVVVVKYGSKSVFSEELTQTLTLLGKVLNKNERAAELIKYIADSKADLESRAERATSSKSIYIGCLGNWGKQSLLSTNKNFPLFTVSNLNNALKDLPNLGAGTITITEEELLSINPEIIIIDAAGIENFKQAYALNKDVYDELDAFKNGEIYIEMPFNCYYTNLEIALMDAYYAASIALPDQYKNFDMEAKANEISKAFLGAEMYTTHIKTMRYAYGGFHKISNPSEFFSA